MGNQALEVARQLSRSTNNNLVGPKTITDQLYVQLLEKIAVKSVDISERKIKQIRDDAQYATKKWRLHVKFLLSKKYTGGRNTTLFPKMRTGALRSSVPTYQVTTLKTFYGLSLLGNETVIRVKRRPLKHPWDTYGDRLDRWKTQLGGWKQRAYSVLNEYIEEIINKAEKGGRR